MHKFDYINWVNEFFDKEIVALVSSIYEYKGRLDAVTITVKRAFEVLSEIAKVQSVGASIRIEGIIASDERIKKLVNNKVRPIGRSEQEILGYSNVLAVIHENYQYVPVNFLTILLSQRDMFKVLNVWFGWKYVWNWDKED